VGIALLGVDVVVIKPSKKIILPLLASFTNIHQVFAEMMEKGKTRVKTVLNIYHQNSNDGQQVFDNSGREEANVVEPMIFIEHQVNEDTAIDAHIVFDFWTAASDTKLDGQTGASGGEPIKGQSRISGNIGARREVGKWSYGTKFGFSSEYDYSSLNGSLDVSRSFAKDNFVLGFSAQYFSDKVGLFRDLSSPSSSLITNDLPRKIFSTSLSASQILTPTDIIQVGASFVRSEKNLESTSSSVVVNGVRTVEDLPDTRSRYAVSANWVHGLGENSALNSSYRYYFDQWDLSAHSLRLAFLQEVNDEEDFYEVFLRYHSQSKVRYYGDSFSSNEVYRTSDADMDKFQSYEAGFFYSHSLGDQKWLGLEFEDVSWGNSIVYYNRTNGLRYGYYQTSIGFEF